MEAHLFYIAVRHQNKSHSSSKRNTKTKPRSRANAIFQLPAQQSVCLASGLAGCTSLLHKYCTTGAWWKPTLLSGTTALWRASLSTVWINCTYKLRVCVRETLSETRATYGKHENPIYLLNAFKKDTVIQQVNRHMAFSNGPWLTRPHGKCVHAKVQTRLTTYRRSKRHQEMWK